MIHVCDNQCPICLLNKSVMRRVHGTTDSCCSELITGLYGNIMTKLKDGFDNIKSSRLFPSYQLTVPTD